MVVIMEREFPLLPSIDKEAVSTQLILSDEHLELSRILILAFFLRLKITIVKSRQQRRQPQTSAAAIDGKKQENSTTIDQDPSGPEIISQPGLSRFPGQIIIIILIF